MSDAAIDNTARTDEEASRTSIRVERQTEVIQHDTTTETSSEADVHRLLEQMARMRELLSSKEAELAEAKSELTFARSEAEAASGEAEAVREDSDVLRREAEAAQREADTARSELELVTARHTVLERDQHAACVEIELQKLREMEELRKDFGLERKQLREDRERELAETREWKLDVLAERNTLRKYIDHLVGQRQDYQAGEVHEAGAEGDVSPPPRDSGPRTSPDLPAMHDRSRNGIEVELNADSPAILEAMGIERRRAEAKADNSNGGDNANLEMLRSQPDPSGDNSTTRSVTFAAQTEEITVNTSSEDMSSHATSKTGADKAAPLENQEIGTSDQIMVTVTRLLEAQRQMMEAQVQAMAAQSVPPLRKFCGENINTDEGSIDRWLEQFAERARVAGWSEEQKLFQLKAHLEKTAEHTVRMLPEEEKSSCSSVVVALQKRFRSLDIEELRGLEFHQLMQEKQSVEALGMELQKLGCKAFPTSSMKEFDRIVKGRFYQALLPKWQRKLGAPKTTETFEELYARARMLERHDQQYGANRGESKQPKHTSSRGGELQVSPDVQNEPSLKGQTVKASGGRSTGRHGGRRGCFHCGELSHIQRNCPQLKPEAVGRSGRVSNLSVRDTGGGVEEAGNVPVSNVLEPTQSSDVEERSLQQLEQWLATMRLNVEQSKLQKSKVGTVVADSVDAVGPVVLLDVQIEGYPVKAVVDTGAQSTIISRDLLQRIAKYMRDAGREDPTLMHPSAKLYGRSGSDSSELTISAEVQFELSLDDHCVKVPVFIQPGSGIPCLLGMNVLPHLGVQFLRGDGMPLTIKSCDVVGDRVQDGG